MAGRWFGNSFFQEIYPTLQLSQCSVTKKRCPHVTISVKFGGSVFSTMGFKKIVKITAKLDVVKKILSIFECVLNTYLV